VLRHAVGRDAVRGRRRSRRPRGRRVGRGRVRPPWLPARCARRRWWRR
jgi:hypothetical protein